MIAGCPKCSARYRVDVERIRDVGAKLRCTKCSAVFLVRAPRPKSETPERQESGPPPTQESPQIDRERLVLVADPSEERGKQSASAIASSSSEPKPKGMASVPHPARRPAAVP